MKKLIFIVFITISNCLFGQHVDITVFPKNYSWTKSFSGSDITDAGNDYLGTYYSESQTGINITSNNQSQAITVFIRKEDTSGDDWDKLNLQISRNGSPYQPIGNNDSVFFIIYGKNNKEYIQYKISGISVLLPVQEFATTIVFTVLQ